MDNKIILVGLNELNFDYIKYYIKEGELPNFKYIFDEYGITETTSENEYKLLEPWIQWVTVTTGRKYDDHNVYRLGDIVERKDLTQVFEVAESKGLSVGAVSPFNADNRLKKAKFFVPDPWTKTKASGSWILRGVSNAVSQTVNDNAKGGLTISSILYILLGLIRYVKPSNYVNYLGVLSKIKSSKGAKAVILDKLLSDVFLALWKKNKPDFSNLFLNTGAHFQHHYMFNSKAYDGDLKNPQWYCPKEQDPLFDILEQYDSLLGDLLKLDVRLMIATGLHQKPHKHSTFYWRLSSHEIFMKYDLLVTDFINLTPRMSRDFLIEFDNVDSAKKCQEKLESLISISDQVKIFTVDNRGESLFVELTYPNDIDDQFEIASDVFTDIRIKEFRSKIAFVAIKNGEHHETGYFVDTNSPTKEGERIELSSIFEILETSFDSMKS